MNIDPKRNITRQILEQLEAAEARRLFHLIAPRVGGAMMARNLADAYRSEGL